jgi:hypothetical protein
LGRRWWGCCGFLIHFGHDQLGRSGLRTTGHGDRSGLGSSGLLTAPSIGVLLLVFINSLTGFT